MKEILQRRYEKNFRRLHRTGGHKHFLTECIKSETLPKFTWIQPQIIKQLNLSSSQVKNYRFDQLQRTLEDQIEKYEFLKNDLNHTTSILSTLIHHSDLTVFLETTKLKIYNSEKINDSRRNR